MDVHETLTTWRPPTFPHRSESLVLWLDEDLDPVNGKKATITSSFMEIFENAIRKIRKTYTVAVFTSNTSVLFAMLELGRHSRIVSLTHNSQERSKPLDNYDPSIGEVAAITEEELSPRSGVPELIDKLGAQSAIPELATLLKTGSPWQRIDAAEALRQMFPQTDNLKASMKGELITIMNDKNSESTRLKLSDPPFCAAYTLLRIERRDREIVKWCVRQLGKRKLNRQSDSESTNLYLVQKEAVRMLGKTVSSEAVEPLVSLLGLSGTDYKFRELAIEALGDIGPDATAAVPQLRRLFARLIKEGRDDQIKLDGWTVLSVVDSIGEIRDRRGGSTLLEACTLNYMVIRSAAVEALKKNARGLAASQ